MSSISCILERMEKGELAPAEELLPLVYDELRRLATGKLAGEAAGQTLQPTALVHEAWLRLGGDQQPAWKNRGLFLASAAEAMRRILVDRARRRQTLKRGEGVEHLDLNQIELAEEATDGDQVLAVNDALGKFAAVHPRKAELVNLRYFSGMSFDEASGILGIAVPTAKEWWAYSRSWLRVEIRRATRPNG
jgi:RNA polymerase sigma factor (TIGR02999 family)